MLKLTLKPGEYIDIGENVRVVFSGGSANNIHLLVDAPREVPVSRSNAGGIRRSSYFKEKGISQEAQKEIAGIIMREKRQNVRDGVNSPKEVKTISQTKGNVYTLHNSRKA